MAPPGSKMPATAVRSRYSVGDHSSARFRGLELLFPYASGVCHARYETPSGAEMNGKLVTFDLSRCMQIARAAGFKGVYSAEFAGAGDPYEGTQKIIDEVVKNL